MKYEKGSFITVPNTDSLRSLPTQAQALFMWMCFYANSEGECFPSRSRLAKDCGWKDIPTVDKWIKVLETTCLIEKSERFNNNEQLSNNYAIILGGVVGRNRLPSGQKPTTPQWAETDTELNPSSLTQSKKNDASVALPQKKTYAAFRDAARARIGNPPMGKRPMTTAQKRVMADLVKIQHLIDQYKELAEKKGLSYLDFPEEMNTKLRRQFLNVIAKYGDESSDFIDWVFTGGHKWAKQTQYNPESCLASFMFDAYKNRGVKEEENNEDIARRLLDSARKRGNGDTDESDYRMWARTGMAKELGMTDNDFFDSEEYKKVKHIIGD